MCRKDSGRNSNFLVGIDGKTVHSQVICYDGIPLFDVRESQPEIDLHEIRSGVNILANVRISHPGRITCSGAELLRGESNSH